MIAESTVMLLQVHAHRPTFNGAITAGVLPLLEALCAAQMSQICLKTLAASVKFDTSHSQLMIQLLPPEEQQEPNIRDFADSASCSIRYRACCRSDSRMICRNHFTIAMLRVELCVELRYKHIQPGQRRCHNGNCQAAVTAAVADFELLKLPTTPVGNVQDNLHLPGCMAPCAAR